MLNCSGASSWSDNLLRTSYPLRSMQTITPKRIPYIRKPFIRPTNWLFRLITWITVSKTGSFLSKSCRVCEKCQLKQSTGTGNVFADILTADPNTIAYTQSCSDHIGYALFRKRTQHIFCCTPQWRRVIMRLFGFVWYVRTESAYRFILLLDLFHPTAFAISIPDGWTKTGFFNHLRCDSYSKRDSLIIQIM